MLIIVISYKKVKEKQRKRNLIYAESGWGLWRGGGVENSNYYYVTHIYSCIRLNSKTTGLFASGQATVVMSGSAPQGIGAPVISKKA